MSKEIVINADFGGFSLSKEAVELGRELLGGDWPGVSIFESEHSLFSAYGTTDYTFRRDDPTLVEVVKRLGDRASGPCADLKIVSIPDDVEWVIEEYDGSETVEEKHRTWS